MNDTHKNVNQPFLIFTLQAFYMILYPPYPYLNNTYFRYNSDISFTTYLSVVADRLLTFIKMQMEGTHLAPVLLVLARFFL